MYTKGEIDSLLKIAADAELEVPVSLLKAEIVNVQNRCNGIGADWQSERSRSILTRVLNYAEATALIHDWQYSNSDGTPERQVATDDLFLINAYREIDFKYPSIFSWKRWRAKVAITAAHTLLKRLGVVAWRLAYAETKLNEEGKI